MDLYSAAPAASPGLSQTRGRPADGSGDSVKRTRCAVRRKKRTGGFVFMMFFGMKAGSTELFVVRGELMERASQLRRHPHF